MDAVAELAQAQPASSALSAEAVDLSPKDFTRPVDGFALADAPGQSDERVEVMLGLLAHFKTF